jgi:hypothetical protein
VLCYIFSDKSEIDSFSYLNVIMWIVCEVSYFAAFLSKPVQTDVDVIKTKNPRILYSSNHEELNLRCPICNKHKFYRASHCTQCDDCIIRRDHHCIFLGICVGYQNTQYFCNYCFWIVVY